MWASHDLEFWCGFADKRKTLQAQWVEKRTCALITFPRPFLNAAIDCSHNTVLYVAITVDARASKRDRLTIADMTPNKFIVTTSNIRRGPNYLSEVLFVVIELKSLQRNTTTHPWRLDCWTALFPWIFVRGFTKIQVCNQKAYSTNEQKPGPISKSELEYMYKNISHTK